MRRRSIAALVLLVSAGLASPVAAELVRLQPRPGVELRIAIEPPRGQAAAYALIFAGGHGKIRLDDNGTPRGLAGNFLIRSWVHLTNRGIGVVMVDAPSDQQGPEGLWAVRLAQVHAADIGHVVRHLRQRFGRPVWLVGTSAGSLSVANGAARLTGAERPDGVVLTSSVTRTTRRIRETSFNANLAAYAGAAFVAAHEGDTCIATPPADAPRLLAALAAARPKRLRMFTGGAPPRSEPCEAASAHGFLGIEAEVMGAIADFIRSPGN
jgi:hypothetical protein